MTNQPYLHFPFSILQTLFLGHPCQNHWSTCCWSLTSLPCCLLPSPVTVDSSLSFYRVPLLDSKAPPSLHSSASESSSVLLVPYPQQVLLHVCLYLKCSAQGHRIVNWQYLQWVGISIFYETVLRSVTVDSKAMTMLSYYFWNLSSSFVAK